MADTARIDLDDLLEQVQVALDANQLDQVRALLVLQHPADIADTIERLPEEGQLSVFQMLPPELAAEVVSEMGAHATEELLSHLLPQEVTAILDHLPTDEVAEILTEDVPQRQQELLALMEAEDAAEVRDLLQYPPQSAGRIMNEKFVRVLPDISIEQVIEYLRVIDPEIETLTDIYVLGPQRTLIGVLSLREVITTAPERLIADVMTTRLVTTSPETDQEEVARLVTQYDLFAIPVVTADQQMLGIVTVDDMIDVLVQESTEDVLRFGGVEGGDTIDQPYFTIPLLRVIRKRVGWLLLLFLAETLTGAVLRLFEDELAQIVALSFFIPLLIGTGGNTGAQTVSTIIRGLALRDIRLRDTWRVLLRELGSGLLLGLLLGTVGFVRALLWGSTPALSVTVGLSVLLICTWSNTIGSLIPLIAYRMGIDPAIVSAPLITTLVDATGLAIYLLIAKVTLGI